MGIRMDCEVFPIRWRSQFLISPLPIVTRPITREHLVLFEISRMCTDEEYNLSLILLDKVLKLMIPKF